MEATLNAAERENVQPYSSQKDESKDTNVMPCSAVSTTDRKTALKFRTPRVWEEHVKDRR
jgi:hypothetical protein